MLALKYNCPPNKIAGCNWGLTLNIIAFGIVCGKWFWYLLFWSFLKTKMMYMVEVIPKTKNCLSYTINSIPADTWRNTSVIITSKRRRFDVIMTLLVHHVPELGLPWNTRKLNGCHILYNCLMEALEGFNSTAFKPPNDITIVTVFPLQGLFGTWNAFHKRFMASLCKFKNKLSYILPKIYVYILHENIYQITQSHNTAGVNL